MASSAETEADLVELAQRLREAAEALRRLPALHARFREQLDDVRHEIQVITTQLRRIH
jgi:hypothetical protein